MKQHNSDCTCWNCPACNFKGYADFRACGQSVEAVRKKLGIEEGHIMVECNRRPQDGVFDPTVSFKDCPEWIESPYGYMLRGMRVMILGIDGYLGWTLALWLSSQGFRVSGVDNYARRKWAKERGSHTVVPIARMTKRLKTAKEILGIDINFREIDIFKERNKLRGFIDEVKPEAVVHYGECPSAPYSMIDIDHAMYVQQNNVLGTLQSLFLMKEIIPEASLIKLATMGEYNVPLTGRPLFEGFFPADAILKWKGKEWSLGGEITPRAGGSFYHISKIHDTFNIKAACQWWWLRSIDAHQGIIYGVHTHQVSRHPNLRTRFDIDEIFGTVVNRFVAQAIIGIPLTLYGAGEQIRGFIALEDAMQCMTRLICHPPEPGQYAVVNQLSGFYQLRDLANIVKKVGKTFGLDVQIQRIENPRVESEKHPYNPIHENLSNVYGFQQKISLVQEIIVMFQLLMQPEMRKRIEEKVQHILPQTRWDGQKKKSERLELIK